MVSTHLKHISQIGSFPQVGVKIKHIWNHHLDISILTTNLHTQLQENKHQPERSAVLKWLGRGLPWWSGFLPCFPQVTWKLWVVSEQFRGFHIFPLPGQIGTMENSWNHNDQHHYDSYSELLLLILATTPTTSITNYHYYYYDHWLLLVAIVQLLVLSFSLISFIFRFHLPIYASSKVQVCLLNLKNPGPLDMVNKIRWATAVWMTLVVWRVGHCSNEKNGWGTHSWLSTERFHFAEPISQKKNY